MARLCIAFAALLLTVAPLGAQDFFDDFNRDDGPADGWFTFQGVADIVDEELVIDANGVETWTWIDSPDPWDTDEISIQFEAEFEPVGDAVGRHGGIMFFASNKTQRWDFLNGYIIDWIDRPQDHGFRFHRWDNGVETAIFPDASFPDRVDPGRLWRISIEGPTISFYVDDELLATFDDETHRVGYVGLYAYSNGNRLHIDNLLISEELPEVDISADPTTGTAPLEVTFNGSGSDSPLGAIEDYLWDFGDGETAEGVEVTHTYLNAGRYAARLTIVDETGVSASGSVDIVVQCPAQDLAPWTTVDIGDPAAPGCAVRSDECLGVVGSGQGFSRSSDGFRFVYQEATGNTILTAHLSAGAFPVGARGGVMLRASLDPGSIFAFSGYHLTVDALPSTTYRATTDGIARTRSSRPAVQFPDSWMRVERQRDDFILSKSPDGVEWTEIRTATIPDAPATMLAGLAITSSDFLGEGTTAEMTVCEISVEAGEESGPRFVRGDPSSNGVVELTDGISILNFLFLGGDELACTDSGDTDDDGNLGISDAVGIFSYLFLGGDPPVDPGPTTTNYTAAECGLDPTPDDALGCETTAETCS